MKRVYKILIIVPLFSSLSMAGLSQKIGTAQNQIKSEDLKSHVSFLASPLLKGRMNGDPELEIAAGYINSQARLLGLKPANGESYLQPFSLIKKSIDPERTFIEIISDGKEPVTIKEPVYQLLPTGASDFTVDGEVVFAGYGINSPNNKYNDFEGVNTEGKIILIMNRSPLSEDGTKHLFKESGWASFMTSLQWKIPTMMYTRARAIMIVTDPKSGYESLNQQFPGISGELTSTKTLKGKKETITSLPGMPKILFVHRRVADAILEGSGYTLDELQKAIDSNLRPVSFQVQGKQVKINEATLSEEIILNNIAGYIEGRDPVLKNEIVVFSGHYDHVGEAGGEIHAGADDNATGTSALLEIAQAFQSLKKKPLRSVLFLWVAGEEIGLFGSEAYVNDPLFPIENTVADINIDMIGRVKGEADTSSNNPMTGPLGVFVIACDQSKDLREIADEADSRSDIDFDYTLSGRNAPLQLFSRSDHYNFVRKDIPVLFYTTGLHTDYHTPGDVIEKIDFSKMEKITRTIFDVGFAVANRKERIVVDNPFSTW